jgi:hypothetical protein
MKMKYKKGSFVEDDKELTFGEDISEDRELRKALRKENRRRKRKKKEDKLKNMFIEAKYTNLGGAGAMLQNLGEYGKKK